MREEALSSSGRAVKAVRSHDREGAVGRGLRCQKSPEQQRETCPQARRYNCRFSQGENLGGRSSEDWKWRTRKRRVNCGKRELNCFGRGGGGVSTDGASGGSQQYYCTLLFRLHLGAIVSSISAHIVSDYSAPTIPAPHHESGSVRPLFTFPVTEMQDALSQRLH